MNSENNINQYNKYLDLNKRYDILVPKNAQALNELYDAHYYDENYEIKPDYYSMSFREDTYCLLEEYLFDFINAECGLLINMYEEEYAEQEQLNLILEITERMINNSDDEKFIVLAKDFRVLVVKAIELGTCIGFFF